MSHERDDDTATPAVLGRRAVIQGAALGTGALTLSSTASATPPPATRPTPRALADATHAHDGALWSELNPEPRPAGGAVRALFGSVTAGSSLEGRWTVLAVHEVRMGAVPVLLRDGEGVRFQLEVLRRDPALPGVGNTGALAVYVSNRGDGATSTREDHGLAAMALARALATNDAAPAGLLTLRERSARYPHGVHSLV